MINEIHNKLLLLWIANTSWLIVNNINQYDGLWMKENNNFQNSHNRNISFCMCLKLRYKFLSIKLHKYLNTKHTKTIMHVMHNGLKYSVQKVQNIYIPYRYNTDKYIYNFKCSNILSYHRYFFGRFINKMINLKKWLYHWVQSTWSDSWCTQLYKLWNIIPV